MEAMTVIVNVEVKVMIKMTETKVMKEAVIEEAAEIKVKIVTVVAIGAMIEVIVGTITLIDIEIGIMDIDHGIRSIEVVNFCCAILYF